MRNLDDQVSGQAPASTSSIQFELTPVDNQRLANLCGPVNKHLHQLEAFYDVRINCRSNQFEVIGDGRRLKTVKNIKAINKDDHLVIFDIKDGSDIKIEPLVIIITD